MPNFVQPTLPGILNHNTKPIPHQCSAITHILMWRHYYSPVPTIQYSSLRSPIPLVFSCEHITVYKPMLTHTSSVFLWTTYSVQTSPHPYHHKFFVNTLQCPSLCSPIPPLFSCEQYTDYKPVLTHIVFLWTKYSVQTCAHPNHYCFPVNNIQHTSLCSLIPSMFSCEQYTAYKPVLTHTINVFLWTKYSIKACTHPYMRNRATTAGRLSADT